MFSRGLVLFLSIVSFCNLLSTKALTLCFPGGPQVVGPLPRTAVMVSLTYHSLSATMTSDLHPGGSWVNATRSGLGPGGCLHLLRLPRLPGSSRQFLWCNSNLRNEQRATTSSFVSPVWRQDCCRYLGRGAEPQVKVNLHTTEPWNVT